MLEHDLQEVYALLNSDDPRMNNTVRSRRMTIIATQAGK